MYANKNTKISRIIALTLAGLMVCPPITGLMAAAQAAPQAAADSAPSAQSLNVKSILLFPTTNNAGANADPITSRLDDAIKIRINSVGKLKGTSYTHFLPSVERALDDNVLSRDDIAPPFTDVQKDNRIATEVETDSFFVASIESYNVDSSGKVSIEASATLYSTATGNSLRSLAYTGRAAPTSNMDTPDMTTQAAIDDVASKIAGSLNLAASGPASDNQASAPPSVSHGGGGILLALLGGALLFALLHKGSSSNNSSSTSAGTSSGAGGSSGSSGGSGSGSGSGGGPPPIPPI